MSLDTELLGHSLSAWAWAGATCVAAVAVLLVLTRLVAVKASQLAQNSHTVIDDAIVDAIRHTRIPFILAAAAWSGSKHLDLGDSRTTVDTAFTLVVLLQLALWLSHVVRYSRDRYASLHFEERAETVTTLSAVSFVARLTIWSLFLILVLDNLGFDVTALLAGLGVGGIAVALALQSILGDLFASLSIAVDKPFVVGDFLVIDDYMGRVEHIGLKSTRLRSLSGEQIIMANSDLLDTRIRNYQRMDERRVVLRVGVVYGTPADVMDEVPSIVQGVVEDTEQARFDRAHFQGFGAYSLDFEVIYFVEDRDYAVFMDVQQNVNLAIYRAFEERGIEFAFPTQTLHLGSSEAAEAASMAA